MGLETFAPGNIPRIRLGDRMFKFADIADVGWATTGALQSGTITDARFTQYPGCEPFAFVVKTTFNGNGGLILLPVSGNTLTWRFPNANGDSSTRPNTTFVYGIY